MTQEDSPTDAQPSAELPDDAVLVGTIAGTHGYDGRLRVELATDNPERFAIGAQVLVAGKVLTVRGTANGPGGVLLVKMDGIDSREVAAQLLHEPISVPLGDVPQPPTDTYYHYQLLDMAVADTFGTALGTITEILSTGANDVYVVTGETSELMVPAIAGVVIDVDVAAGRMTVDPPEGLDPRPLTPPKSPSAKRRPRRRKPRRAR
jgi:16S rRNA processing protein RimM